MADSSGSNGNLQGNSSFSDNRRLRKRPHPAVFSGSNPVEKNFDYLCPICFEMIKEAYMTRCGHTFCYTCISTSLEYTKRCPKCNFAVESTEDIYPNFLLNELIAKSAQQNDPSKITAPLNHVTELHDMLTREKRTLTITEINDMLDVLGQKKQQLEADCRENQIILLKEFLHKVRTNKQSEIDHINDQLKVINHDVDRVEEMLQHHQASASSKIPHSSLNLQPSTSIKQEGFNGTKYVHHFLVTPTMSSRRKRICEHFDSLKESYLQYRATDHTLKGGVDVSSEGLGEFHDDLCKFGRYSSIRALATLNYTADNFIGSNIVSSIEFDRDLEFFAIAGVTKKIKVFDYCTVIRDSIDLHYPVCEMLCNSKISCLSWSTFNKGLLASSDYEGAVTLWDAFSGQRKKVFQEHEKRAWSVDFNHVDTQLIASASDDGKVKLWSTNMDHSVATLDSKANVCCVKFSPDSKHNLAFGSADHCVHYYDLRNPSKAVQTFKGHKKAVSYVKFLGGEELVSASTDGNLKLWNVKHSHCTKSFVGHINEKNFVGLATDGDFVACGSENNSLYVYFKGISTQVLTFKFDALRSVLEKRRDEDSNEFVSAVCWRTSTNIVVAANSQGSIKILELVS